MIQPEKGWLSKSRALVQICSRFEMMEIGSLLTDIQQSMLILSELVFPGGRAACAQTAHHWSLLNHMAELGETSGNDQLPLKTFPKETLCLRQNRCS